MVAPDDQHVRPSPFKKADIVVAITHLEQQGDPAENACRARIFEIWLGVLISKGFVALSIINAISILSCF
jgi:hypothetical protein